MNLDELQSVQARERQSSDLQHLRASFYREVGEFIKELTEERAQAVERAEDPFSSPEVRRISDDIETAEQTVEAIYERRVGKVVKKASIAAAGMPVDDDGLTEEEEALFEDLVARIEENRETVLSVLDGDAPSVSCSIDEETDATSDEASPSPSSPPEPDADEGSTPGSAPASGSEPGGVSAADLMGGDREDGARPSASDPESPEPAPPSDDPPAADSTTDPEPPGAPGGASTSESDPDLGSPADAGSGTPPDRSAVDPGSETDERSDAVDREVPGVPRTTVRITADVGEVVGADDRDYDLGPEDVVTLPEPNAEVLVEKDAAERLE